MLENTRHIVYNPALSNGAVNDGAGVRAFEAGVRVRVKPFLSAPDRFSSNYSSSRSSAFDPVADTVPLLPSYSSPVSGTSVSVSNRNVIEPSVPTNHATRRTSATPFPSSNRDVPNCGCLVRFGVFCWCWCLRMFSLFRLACLLFLWALLGSIGFSILVILFGFFLPHKLIPLMRLVCKDSYVVLEIVFTVIYQLFVLSHASSGSLPSRPHCSNPAMVKVYPNVRSVLTKRSTQLFTDVATLVSAMSAP